MADIRNTDDTIHKDDVEERIDELKDELADVIEAQEAFDEAKEELDAYQASDDNLADLEEAYDKAEKALEDLQGEFGPELEELKDLEELLEIIEQYSGDGLLINDDHFEDYARQLAEDIGAIDRNASWPLGCIDWEQAADELKTDYTSIEFGSETFWTRG